MATIVKIGYSGSAPNQTGFSGPSLATLVPGPEHQTIGTAGEAIAAGDLGYIKNDGKIWRTNGTAANAAAEVEGMAAMKAGVGEAVTLYHGVEFIYSSGMTPGAKLYASATAGALDDAATTGGTKPVARVQPDGARIFVQKSNY